jgi:NADH dehydrogenase
LSLAAAGGRPHVVIVGGGFGGLRAAKRLRRAAVDVTLIDRRNHHLFQPLLYQVATGSLSPGEIAPPLRGVLRRERNVRVLLADAHAFDLANRVVRATGADDEKIECPYDFLVVAAGSTNAYFGHDDWHRYAPSLKTIDDAIEIRDRILLAFEAAEVETDEAARRALMTFVLVGAGPTGVEMAGQIAELARDTLRRDYRSIDTASARVLLLEGGPRVLAGFDEKLSAHTVRSLAGLGVDVRTGALVAGVDGRGVDVDTAEGRQRIEARTVIWTAGVRASPVAEELARQSGMELDRAGRIPVQPDMTLPGHPEVFVLGDMTALGLPGTSPVAMQQGSYAAEMIKRTLAGRERRPFRFRDKGNLATIGRYRAVAEIGRLRFSGLVAWLLWLVVHITYLIGFANRLLVMLRWFISFVTHGRVERVITRQIR